MFNLGATHIKIADLLFDVRTQEYVTKNETEKYKEAHNALRKLQKELADLLPADLSKKLDSVDEATYLLASHWEEARYKEGFFDGLFIMQILFAMILGKAPGAITELSQLMEQSPYHTAKVSKDENHLAAKHICEYLETLIANRNEFNVAMTKLLITEEKLFKTA